MNFFEQQRQAHKNTKFLVFLFAVAMIFMIIATNVAAWVVHDLAFAMEGEELQRSPFTWPSWEERYFYLYVTAATIGFMLCGYIYKWITLGTNGHRIAKTMGGTPISSFSKDSNDKKIMNVVAEMSIASGLTPPPVYIMRHQNSINAFAAGLTPQTSVIALTQGAIEKLGRDELQGVVGHELSHILNGDTRLNVKLIGYLSGLVAMGLLGRIMLDMLFHSGTRYRRRSRRSGSGDGGGQIVLLIFVIGLLLYIIGSVGVLVGRLIRAAVSRQREFLADASAVQFTRYPAGIASALVKILYDNQGFGMGVQSEEISHMCFENPGRGYFLTSPMFSTHPPTTNRIERIDKRYLDTQFIKKNVKFVEKPKVKPAKKKKEITHNEIINSIGVPDPGKIVATGLILQSLIPQFNENREPLIQANSIALALLNMTGNNKKASELVESYEGHEIAEEFRGRALEFSKLPREYVLPTLMLCIPILREEENEERLSFLKTAEYLAKSDGQVDFHEMALYFVLETHLKPIAKRELNKQHSLNSVWPSANIIFAALAHHSHQAHYDAVKAYQQAQQFCGKKKTILMDVDEISFARVRKALIELNDLTPKAKEKFFNALLVCVEHDNKIQPEELEFLRAITDTIGIPLPAL